MKLLVAWWRRSFGAHEVTGEVTGERVSWHWHGGVNIGEPCRLCLPEASREQTQ